MGVRGHVEYGGQVLMGKKGLINKRVHLEVKTQYLK